MLDGIGGTGILSTMKYVNIDQKLPRIGIRQQQAMGLKKKKLRVYLMVPRIPIRL